MGAYAKDVVAESELSDTDKRALTELRKTIDGLAKDIAGVAERQARNATEAVEAGASTVRRNIRRQPAMAMGVAAVAGAALAIAIVPRRSSRRSSANSWSDWSPVTRADLHDFADGMQRSMTRAMRSVNSVPITSSLERVADALTKAEHNAGVSSALEKVGGWFSRMQSNAADLKKKV